MSRLNDILDYYENLLIIQYHNKSKAKATIRENVKSLIADDLACDIKEAFNLDSAVGVQLDIIGKWVGVNRFYKGFELEDPFFAFVEYDEETPYNTLKKGFTTYADYDTKEGETLNYYKALSGGKELGDDDFRILIKLKIVQNNINHSHQSIDDSIYNFFGTDIIPDSDGNMQMVYFIKDTVSLIGKVARQKEVLPRPIGVGVNAIEFTSSTAFFGFTNYNDDANNNLSTGFTTYADYDTKSGKSLNFEKIL